MASQPSPLRNWYRMSAGEQIVWGAAYATHAVLGPEAASHADAVINSLAQCEWPEQEEPEHRASRLVRGLTFEAFRAWYVVEHQLLYSGRVRPKLSEEQISEAYKTYLMCGSDYY